MSNAPKPPRRWLIRDVTSERRRSVQHDVEDSARLEALVSQVAAQFRASSAQTLRPTIQQTLREFGEVLQIDRGFFARIEGAPSSLWLTHEWFRAGFASARDAIDGARWDDYPWLSRQLQTRHVVAVEHGDPLPEQASGLRRWVEALGCRSWAIIPLHADQKLHGFMALASGRRGPVWTADRQALLRFAVDAMAEALERVGEPSQTAKTSTDPTPAPQPSSGEILAAAPDWIYAVDPEGRLLYVNKSLRGKGAADLIGRSIYDMTPPPTRLLLRDGIERVLRSKRPASYRGAGAHGRVFETRIAPQLEGPAVRRLVLSSRDVTDSDRLQSRVAVEHRLYSLLSQSPRPTVEELLAFLASEAERCIPAWRASIHLLQASEQRLSCIYGRCLPADYRDEIAIWAIDDASDPLVEAVRTGRPQVVADLEQLGESRYKTLALRHRIGAVWTLPLIGDGAGEPSVAAVLAFARPAPGSPTDVEMEAALWIAGLAARCLNQPPSQEIIREAAASTTEVELQDEADAFRSLFEASPDARVLLDTETAVPLLVSQGLVQFLGYGADVLSQQPLFDHQVEQQGTTPRSLEWHVRRRDPSFETRMVNQRGVSRDVHVDLAEVEWRGGIALHLVLRDVTELKLSQQAIQDSEERFFKAFRDIPVAIAIVDFETRRVLDANPQFLSVCGLARGELIGQGLADLDVWEDEAAVEGLLRAAAPTSGAGLWQGRLRHRSGRVTQVSIRAGATELGGKACAVVAIVDPDGVERAEELEEAAGPDSGAHGAAAVPGAAFEGQLDNPDASQAAQHETGLAAIAGGITHDINNALTAVMGYTETLLDQHPGAVTEEPVRGGLAQIKVAARQAIDAAQRLRRTVRNRPADAARLDLNLVVQQLQRALPRVVGATVQLETELEPQLVPVIGIVSQLEQFVLSSAPVLMAGAEPATRLVIETANVRIEEPHVQRAEPMSATHAMLRIYGPRHQPPVTLYLPRDSSTTTDPSSERSQA